MRSPNCSEIPDIGSLWQHQKHDPQAGKHHQYRVKLVTVPAMSPAYHGNAGLLIDRFACTHKESGAAIFICSGWGDGRTFYAYGMESRLWEVGVLVVYRNIRPEQGGEAWARPLHLFNSGKFTGIEAGL